MNGAVLALATAFEKKGIKYYAPRAKNFLDTEECLVTFGLFAKIFEYNTRIGEPKYSQWFTEAINAADNVITHDESLARFITARQKQIEFVKKNYNTLFKYCEKINLNLQNEVDIPILGKLALAPDLDPQVKNALGKGQLKRFVDTRKRNGNAVSVSYVLNRITALDWTALDLFYHLNCFDYFSKKYETAEEGGEDSGMYNLGMITDYIARFMETSNPILSGASFQRNGIAVSLFDSFLYMIFRRGETEFEDSEDPFPKGCVPFITIHQSKGLEFPVVILGSMSHTNRSARRLDVLVRDIQKENNEIPLLAEPLDKMDMFDAMRMFYVALSRAKNLVILSWPKAARVFDKFKEYLASANLDDIDSIDLDTIPNAKVDDDELAHVYSYTADFLPYEQCPRNYMVFHKYGFVPSRSQTMFFGSLVHQTIEDLQNYLMANTEGN